MAIIIGDLGKNKYYVTHPYCELRFLSWQRITEKLSLGIIGAHVHTCREESEKSCERERALPDHIHFYVKERESCIRANALRVENSLICECIITINPYVV